MHPLILAGFCAMRGLAAEDEHPPRASRPFDATRAGFVMGEGACVLVLEELDAARARGAKVYAEVLGYGASNDAYHMAAPDPASVGVAEMMRAALARAGVDPSDVGYVNAHGTSTPLGDPAETKAIKDVFGDHAYELAVSSTKSMTGHCFGAAGAIEAMMCVLAIHEGVAPADDQLRAPRSRVRSRLRPERGARGAGRRRALERDGPRRPQRLRPARPRRKSLASRAEMAFIVNEQVEEYAGRAHDAAGRALRPARRGDAREDRPLPQMMVGRIEGGFLASLVRLTGAKRILELGTFTGYSSIAMASALADGRPDRHAATSTRRRPRSRAATWTRAGTATRSRSSSARRWRRSSARRPVRPRLHRRGQAELPGATTRPCCRCWPTTA